MKIVLLNGELAWSIIAYCVIRNKKFKSLSGIEYQVRIQGKTLFYKGGDRNKGEEECLEKDDFVLAFDRVKDLPVINTNTIKSIIPNEIYRKRTPFIGLLISANVLQ